MAVFRQLRDEIVQGTLRPNQRITEAEQAERLGISRTPVREAFQLLAHNGLIVSRRRGWVVYEVTLEEAQHYSQIRAALEGYAAGLAAMTASPQDVDALEAKYMSDIADMPQHRTVIVTANEQFHNGVTRLSGNPMLVKLVEDSRRFYFNHNIESLYTDEELQASMSDHPVIIDALRRRDAATAERVAREHVEQLIVLMSDRWRR